MINFLHTNLPDPVLVSFWGIDIYWYGFLILMGVVLGFLVSKYLAKKYNFPQENLFDIYFWLIILGILGARLYEILLVEPGFYFSHPIEMLKIWQGGLAIHGSIIVGIIVIWFFSRKIAKYYNKNIKRTFWQLTSILAPAVILGQAIGRWGNYFNQELFGIPTKLSWGIPIELANRPIEFVSHKFFHPTFLYESLGNLIIFIILISMHAYIITKRKTQTFNFIVISLGYIILYSILRFFLEFIRIDTALSVFSLRWPQIISLILIVASMWFIFKEKRVLTKK